MADQTIDKVQLEISASANSSLKVVDELVSKMNALKSVLGSLDVSKLKSATSAARSVSLDTSGMTKSEKEITSSIDKIKKSMAGLKAYKDAGLLGDGSSLVSASRRITNIQSDIDKLGETLRQASDKRTGVNIDTDKLQAYRTELAEMQAKMTETKGVVDAAIADMKAKKIKLNTKDAEEDAETLGQKIKKVSGNLLVLSGQTISSGFKNIRSGFGNIKNTISDISGRISKFANTGLMKILRYGFGIRSLYVLFRRLKEAVKDSFGALQSSGAMFETTRANIEGLKNSLQTLKFQFGAAFEPIFNAVAPALQTLIDYLVTVMNVISAFFAKLMGRSTYSKVSAVLNKTGGAAGGAAKAVKELNHQLQGFDELNNLTLDPGSSGGGGGGGGGGAGGAMYEAADVDSVLGDFAQELADNIRAGKWFEVGRAISDKLSEVMESIPWDSIYEKARNFGKGLADFLNGLITPRLFGDLGKTIAGAINTVFEAGGSFAKEFDWENLGNSIGTGITEFFETANFGQWGETVHDWVAGILDAGIELLKSTDFEKIGEKLADFLNGLDIADLASKLYNFALTLGGAIAEALKGLWDNSSLNTKIGLAVVGLIAAGKLTGLASKLGTVIANYFVTNPIALGKVALVVGTAVVSFEGAKWVFEKMAESFGDEELASYYKNFSWSEFWETIQTPDGSGIDWAGIKEAWADMMEDYWTPLFEEIDYWIDELKEKINSLPIVRLFNDMKSKIKAAWNGFGDQDNGVPHGYNGAPSDVAQRLDYQNSVKYWNQQGANIVDGIAEGIELSLRTNPFTAPMVLVYKAVTGAFGDTFDSHSPAKKMYPLGKNILTGIVEGFKKNIQKYVPDMLTELYNSLTLKDLGQTGSSRVNEVANDLYNMVQENQNGGKSGSTKKTVTINTKMTGAIKTVNQMLQLGLNWNSFSNSYNDRDASLTTSMLGAFKEVGDVKTAGDNFRNLDRDYRSKNVTYTTSMGGEIKNKDEIDVARSKYENLYKAWESRTSTLSTNTGGQFKNIGDADTWRDKFTNLLSKWNSKSSTLSATTGGQFKTINDADTWGSKIQDLLKKWVGKSLTMTANFNQPLSTIQSYADQVSKLYDSWKGRSANFSISASVTADNINQIANDLISKINAGLAASSKYQLVKVAKAKGGIFSGGAWHNIPQYASGTLNAGSMFIAGEAGPEIVGSINGRTEVLNRSQIAATIKAATISGMRLFRGTQMVRPTEISTDYSNTNSYSQDMNRNMASNTEAILTQNRLLQEQNELLRVIADKDVSISPREVFNATRSEADNYYKRTGNSAFLY